MSSEMSELSLDEKDARNAKGNAIGGMFLDIRKPPGRKGGKRDNSRVSFNSEMHRKDNDNESS